MTTRTSRSPGHRGSRLKPLVFVGFVTVLVVVCIAPVVPTMRVEWCYEKCAALPTAEDVRRCAGQPTEILPCGLAHAGLVGWEAGQCREVWWYDSAVPWIWPDVWAWAFDGEGRVVDRYWYSSP